MEDITIIGAGWLGKALAIYLKEQAYNVSASNRSTINFNNFKKLGINPFVYDLDKPDRFNETNFKSETLIFTAAYKNTLNFKRFLIRLEENTCIKNIIFISSTSVYGKSKEVITEETPTKKTILSEMEEVLMNTSFNSVILRFGGLIGYNRHPKNYINRTVPMPLPNGVVNWVHRDDCILIINELLKQDIQSKIYNVCATAHPKRKEIYTQLALHYDMPLPIFEETNSNSIKCISNKKIKTELGYKFKYDDFDFLFN